MRRRDFLLTTGLATGTAITGLSHRCQLIAREANAPIRWHRDGDLPLFSSVSCDGRPLADPNGPGLLSATCRSWHSTDGQASKLSPLQPAAKHGPLHLELSHQLHRSGSGIGEDLLHATLSIRNESDQPQPVELAFVTNIDPSPTSVDQQLYLPLNAAALNRDKRFASLGVEDFIQDCHVNLEHDAFQCHYLEPMASYPDERKTTALLLAPVVDITHPSQPWRVALFTVSDQPIKFRSMIGMEGKRLWQIGRVVTVPAGQTIKQSCWLMIHRDDASVAWNAFHKFAHEEPHPPIDWVREFKVCTPVA